MALPAGQAPKEQLETPNAQGMVNEIKTIEKKDAPVVIVENDIKADAVVEIQPQADVQEEGKVAEA